MGLKKRISATHFFKYQPDPWTDPDVKEKVMPPGKGEKGLGALISISNLDFWGTPHFGKKWKVEEDSKLFRVPTNFVS